MSNHGLDQVQSVGAAGVVGYSCLLFLALVRMRRHCIPLKAPWLTSRKVFHGLMVIYAFLSALANVSFLEDRNYER